MIDLSRAARDAALDDGARRDLIIVGGGITGAGVALDAAARGFRPLLLEKGDFVSGTSSRTTKLIHGGLRYLRRLELGLVREAATERARLRRMAPHLIEEITFVLPVRRASQRIALGTGLALYDALGGFPSPGHRFVDGAYRFADSKADDCRLTLHVLKKAVQLGARAANYAQVREVSATGVRVIDTLRNREIELNADRVVVAAGVWTDGLVDGKRLRPTKGIHLVVPLAKLGVRDAMLLPLEDGRVAFAVPWGDKAIVGTTDTDYSGDLDHPRANVDDVAYLRGIFHLEPGDILATYAGLRPLMASATARPSDATRDFAVRVEPSGVVVVTGGKLTTFRAMAKRVVDRMFPHAPASPTDLLDLFAPRAAAPDDLQRAYGSEAQEILAMPDQQPIHESSPRRVAEIDYCVRAEGCFTVADFLCRRTRAVLFDPERGRRSAEPVARRMASLLGWDAKEAARQIDAFEREMEEYATPV